jgi:GR25 family glycosyltransferase involved in LPS biosynthesis
MYKIYIILFFLLVLFLLNQKGKENFINNIPIYCINLKKSINRWNNTKKQFNKLNLEIIRFDAINGADIKINNYLDKINLDYDTTLNSECDSKIKPGLKLKLSNSEIGCALSHFFVWEKMLTNNINKALIVEDDIKPSQKLKDYDKYISKMPQDWDIIYVSFINTGPKKYINKNIYIPSCGFSASGYIINLKGIKKIMKEIPIRGPLDLFLLELFRKKIINVYVIENLCDASQTWGGQTSQIEHSTRNIKKFKI